MTDILLQGSLFAAALAAHLLSALAGGSASLFAIGLLNGSLTSGTWLFETLWLVHWFGFDYSRAVACTLILVGLFWNSTSALTLGLQGQMPGTGCRHR